MPGGCWRPGGQGGCSLRYQITKSAMDPSPASPHGPTPWPHHMPPRHSPITCPHAMAPSHAPTPWPRHMPPRHGPVTCPHSMAPSHAPTPWPHHMPPPLAPSAWPVYVHLTHQPTKVPKILNPTYVEVPHPPTYLADVACHHAEPRISRSCVSSPPPLFPPQGGPGRANR